MMPHPVLSMLFIDIILNIHTFIYPELYHNDQNLY